MKFNHVFFDWFFEESPYFLKINITFSNVFEKIELSREKMESNRILAEKCSQVRYKAHVQDMNDVI